MKKLVISGEPSLLSPRSLAIVIILWYCSRSRGKFLRFAKREFKNAFCLLLHSSFDLDRIHSADFLRTKSVPAGFSPETPGQGVSYVTPNELQKSRNTSSSIRSMVTSWMKIASSRSFSLPSQSLYAICISKGLMKKEFSWIVSFFLCSKEYASDS